MKNKLFSTLGLLATLSYAALAQAGEGGNTPVTFKNVTAYVASTPADPTRPAEVVTEFESFMPIDVVLDFNYTGEATEATIVVSGAFYGNHDASLAKSWQSAKKLSQMVKVKLAKGANRIKLLRLPVDEAANQFVDHRKKGVRASLLGLTFSVFVKDKEVGSIQKSYNAHIL